MSKKIKLSDLVGKSNLRELVAAKLGAGADNIPEEALEGVAKSLKVSVPAAVVEYTTKKTNKTGIYLSANPVPGGRGIFEKLGNPDDEVTEETVEKLRSMADGLFDASETINNLCEDLVTGAE